MTDDQQAIKVEHRIRLEKRNDAGELYETVEIAADEEGRITEATVIERRDGLAPPEAYAPIQPGER